MIGRRVGDARRALCNADAVCLDVDSTVITSESIDDLADFLGCGDQVAMITARAMGGAMPYHQALETRLKIMRPSQREVAQMLEERPAALTAGAVAFVDALHERGQHVYLVSGGFRQLIAPVAAQLGVPEERVQANQLTFNADGSFGGHAHSEPTAWQGGKAVGAGHPARLRVQDGGDDRRRRD